MPNPPVEVGQRPPRGGGGGLATEEGFSGGLASRYPRSSAWAGRGARWAKGGCLPSTLQPLGREGCHVGKGNEKKISGAFSATIYMAGNY